jgi:hypothetical protein
MRDIERMERYYENVPYGEKSRPSEIHGKANQEIINNHVVSVVNANDEAVRNGDQVTASRTQTLLYHIDKEVANAEVVKQEHASSLYTTSDFADMSFLDKAMLEECVVSFDENGKMNFTVDDGMGGFITKTIEEMSADFVEKGDWMQPLMNAKQELINARNDRGNPPPFDINYFVNNLIDKNWKSMIGDRTPTRDPNGPDNGYILQAILLDHADENGSLPPDFNIDKFSFNPKFDHRLFKAVSDELHGAFYGVENLQPQKPQTEAQKLMARLDGSPNQI